MQTRFARTLILALSLVVVTMPMKAFAHCRIWHPHHCLGEAWEGAKDLVGDIIGGTSKRARMVWDDPLGTLVNPLKVIDSSIPTPLSYVEYAFKNPDELIDVLKDPVAGVVGLPVAIAVADGRQAALGHGVQPIPPEMKAQLSPYFTNSLLDSVRYTSGRNLFDGLLQGIALNTNSTAITLVNVIVFKNATGPSSAESVAVWAHELFHVKQYKDKGLTGFAAEYTLDFNSIEDPAYHFDELYSAVRRTRLVTSSMLIGLGHMCMKADNPRHGAPVVLGDCHATDGLQQFVFSNDHSIRQNLTNLGAATDLCLDVRGANNRNRTPLQMWRCNGTDAQVFKATPSGQLRSALRKGLCVEAAGGRTAPGTPVQVYDCNGTASQNWNKPGIEQVSGESRTCITATGGDNGDAAELRRCNRNVPGQWLSRRQDDEIRLIAWADKCLHPLGPNGLLTVADCRDLDSNRFRLTDINALQRRSDTSQCLQEVGDRIGLAGCISNRASQKWNTRQSLLPNEEPDDVKKPDGLKEFSGQTTSSQ